MLCLIAITVYVIHLMKQSIRIIGGQFRGKKLTFPAQSNVRPTPDRVRETLFNWLMHDIHNAHCLDAFAGSGALGIEAFSRGAASVTLIELESSTHAQLQRTLSAFNSTKLTLLQDDACAYLKHSSKQFDIVFCDPPFTQPELLTCLQTLAHRAVLKEGGWLYLESAEVLPVSTVDFEQIKQKRCGSVVFTLYKKRCLTSEDAPVSINKIPMT